MIFLGLDFIISSLLWLFSIAFFVFIFRKQIKRFFSNKRSLADFISQLKIYLEKNYPKINFDYDIIEKTKEHNDINVRMYLIVDNIILQYTKLELDRSKFPRSTPKSLQWGGYVFNSEPNRDKLPIDWKERKTALLTRDKQTCFRCSKHLNTTTVQVHMIKPLENGGKYFLENLIPVCSDCKKLLEPVGTKTPFLTIKHDLYNIVETHLYEG